MAMKHMENQEMLATTGPWLESGSKPNRAFHSHKLTSAVLDEVDIVHTGLLDVAQPKEERLVQIKDEQGTTDARHDPVVRGVVKRLESEEDLAKTPEGKQRFRKLRETLYAEGIALTQRSYRYEAGHGKIVESLLGSKERALLASLKTHSGTLLDAVTEHIQLAAQLNTLDRERTEIETAPKTGNQDNMSARNEWIRVVQMMREAVARVVKSGVVDEVLAAEMTRLQEVEAHATRRYLARKAGSDADPGDDQGDEVERDTATVDDTADPVEPTHGEEFHGYPEPHGAEFHGYPEPHGGADEFAP